MDNRTSRRKAAEVKRQKLGSANQPWIPTFVSVPFRSSILLHFFFLLSSPVACSLGNTCLHQGPCFELPALHKMTEDFAMSQCSLQKFPPRTLSVATLLSAHHDRDLMCHRARWCYTGPVQRSFGRQKLWESLLLAQALPEIASAYCFVQSVIPPLLSSPPLTVWA